MGYVTPEQIAQAKEWDLLTYLQRYDPHQLVHVPWTISLRSRAFLLLRRWKPWRGRTSLTRLRRSRPG